MPLKLKTWLKICIVSFVFLAERRTVAQTPVLTIQDGQLQSEDILDNGLLAAPGGQFLLTYTRFGVHSLWDIPTGKLVRSFNAAGNINSLDNKGDSGPHIGGPSLSVDGKFLVTEGGAQHRGSYLLWDAQTGKVLKTISTNYLQDSIAYTSAEIISDGHILTHGFDPKRKAYLVELRELRSGGIKAFYYNYPETKVLRDRQKENPDYTYGGGPLAATIGGVQAYVAIGSSEGNIYLFDAQNLKYTRISQLAPVRKFSLGDHRLSKVCFSKDNRYLIASNVDQAKVWDIASGKEVQWYQYPYNAIESMNIKSVHGKLSGNGECIAIYDTLKNALKVYETASRKILRSVPAQAFGWNAINKLSELFPLQISNDGHFLFDFSREGNEIQIMDLARAIPLRPLTLSTRYNLTTGIYDPGKREFFIGKTFSDAFRVNLSTGKIDNFRRFYFTPDTMFHADMEIGGTRFVDNHNIRLSYDGQYLLTYDMALRGMQPQKAIIWDRASGLAVDEIEAPPGQDTDPIDSVLQQSAGRKWAPLFEEGSGGISANIQLREAASKKGFLSVLRLFDHLAKKELLVYPYGIRQIHIDNDYKTRILDAMLVDGGKQVMARMMDGVTLFYDTSNGELLKSYPPYSYNNGMTRSAMAPGPGLDAVYAAYSSGYRDGGAMAKVIKISLGSGQAVREYGPQDGIVNSVSVLDNGRLIATVSDAGTVKFWDESTANLLATMMINGNDYFVFTPDGYYTASKKGIGLVHFVAGMKIYLAQQFDLKYNRPDKVWESLGTLEPKYLRAYQEAWQRRAGRKGLKYTNTLNYGQATAPEIKITNRSDNQYQSSQIALSYRCEDKNNPIASVAIWVDGVPLFGYANPIKVGQNTKAVAETVTVPLRAGRNVIEVAATNTLGIESLHEVIEVNSIAAPEKPNLYLISIGVNTYKNLNALSYPAKDAREVAALFKPGKLFGKIIFDTLMNGQFSTEALAGIKGHIKNARPSDYLLIFYSGHGLKDDAGAFFLGTTGVSLTEPAQSGVPVSALVDLSAATACRNKLILLDACYSGEADTGREKKPSTAILNYQQKGEGGPVAPIETNPFDMMKDLFEDLSGNSFGATIIAATRGYATAGELERLQNGLFTYYLKKGLSTTEADYNGNKKIELDELQRYVTENVAQESKNFQVPVSRSENGLNNFVIQKF